ncbi:family 43 glycosylhydrolase [Arthrobacter sp. ISL-48]|uniref:family 43 glycosylhydrolase n=1 Tax=Arthrobacter sp. ISL-48 TaxID=2819110 RepID=UPI001BE8FC27|nr:family 43 glycosylhydrolase [Arthrobacter sp. ISL-48]MBT2532230.1 family 43 glycosylhydrolase [Arthrobacter sp. ISL-48]
MTLLTNPVLPGFSPDPSLIRVGEWFYLANSSFEWYPTVPIHRSRNLVDWEYAGSFSGPDALLDLRGLQDSGAIWAPSLSWGEGNFWLVFTVVRAFGGPHKDMDTYISRAGDVAGPWSAPARVTTTGFDPSIFHHEGRHWLLNMEWDHRPTGRGGFAGINLQELNATGTATIGQPKIIHRRPALIEGPNLYFFAGKYYLMLAEGGTGQNHGIAMMRSDDLLGPYEADPHGPVLTTRDEPSHELQKAGHGEIAVDAQGQMFLAHLASRWTEKDGKQYSVLGRETCIQRLRMTDDGWLRLEQGGWAPALTVKAAAFDGEAAAAPRSIPADSAVAPARDQHAVPNDVADGFGGFGGLTQGSSADGRLTVGWPWSTLRHAADASWASLSDRPGWLRIRGRHSTDSLFEQSLIARRLTGASVTAGVTLEAQPANFTQSAGLIFYYNTASYLYLRTTVREVDGELVPGDAPVEQIVEVFEKDPLTGLQSHGAVVVDPRLPLRLEGSLDGARLQFRWTQGNMAPRQIGPELGALQLSDDHGGSLRFTGAFVGVAAQDLRDRSFTADFTDFLYRTDEAQ